MNEKLDWKLKIIYKKCYEYINDLLGEEYKRYQDLFLKALRDAENSNDIKTKHEFIKESEMYHNKKVAIMDFKSKLYHIFND